MSITDTLTGRTRISGEEFLQLKLKPETPQVRLRKTVLSRIQHLRNQGFSQTETLEKLFPNTVVEEETLQTVVSSLIAGNHILIFGPSGSGKTNLAKDIWTLFPKDVLVVEGCPVLDNPFSLLDKNFSKNIPPCPFCKSKLGELKYDELGSFDVSMVDPKKVNIIKTQLHEGYGYARIQGSSEVFPDHLTGNINLHKLEKIGDPTSPLVMEPGKLMQANRGVLLIDEIGKLPLGSQNVLLQSLQEFTVTPAKSRETFPASFIAITTSNLQDLDNITEPLNDRLASIHMSFNKVHEKNRRIISIGLTDNPLTGFVPEIFVDASIRLIEAWRTKVGENPELSEVGSNRSMIDIIQRMESYALLQSRTQTNMDDFYLGIKDAMFGRIRARSGDSFAHNTNIVSQFIEKNVNEYLKKSAAIYWCRFFKNRLKSDNALGKEVIKEGRRLINDRELISKFKTDKTIFTNFQRFVEYCKETEKFIGNMHEVDVALTVFSIINSLQTFECDKISEDEL